MNGFGVIVAVFIGVVFLSVLVRLGRSINSTRRMSGQGMWSSDGPDTGRTEQDGIDHGRHHNSGHHNVGGHHAGGGDFGGHHGGGGHDFGGGGSFGGGGDIGGGHHG